MGNVEGEVLLDGQPVTTGTVRFEPAAGRAATGEIRPDGTFTLGTFHKSDGALVGTHKVAIIAYEVLGPKPSGPVRDPTVTRKSKPLVPPRFMSTGTSNLTFEVKPGRNHAPFHLESK